MPEIKWLPRPAQYQPVWQAMYDFTEQRDAYTPDEIWLVEHAPVYTLGQAGKLEHILDSSMIPVVSSNRGGQVTYHGPGQIVVYCLIDLRRADIFVKEYVALLEDVILGFLDELGIRGACRQAGAPGVYVPVPQPPSSLRAAEALRQSGLLTAIEPKPSAAAFAADAVTLDNPIELAKVAALGIKVRRGCAYHGLALNVAMDLTPFDGINPCGYEGLKTVDLAGCGVTLSVTEVGDRLAQRVVEAFETRG